MCPSDALQTALHPVPIAVAITDRAGRILAVSAALERLLGFSREELEGERLVRFVQEGGPEEALWRELLDGARDRLELECHLTRRDGQGVPARLQVWAVPGEAGAAAFALALVDTAATELAGRQVVAQQLDRALDRISDGFVVFDRGWRYLYINLSAEQYFQLPREQLLGRVIWEAFPGLHGSEVERGFRRAAAEGEVVELEFSSPVTHRWVLVRAYPSEKGLSAYFRDITKRKEAELALLESERRYRSMFENSLDGIELTSPTGEIFAANPAACEMMGRTEEEIRRLGRDGILDTTDPRLPAFLEERRRTGRGRGELTILRKDGTKLPVEVSSSVFRDASGAERTSLSFRDLTERKRAEDALRLLVEAGEVLAGSLDYQTTLQSLTRLVVPRLADLCTVDLADGEALHRVAAAHRDPSKEASLRALREGSPGLIASAGVEKVLRTLQPEFIPTVTAEWLHAAARNPAHFEALRTVGVTSVLMVPLVERGRAIGVLSLAVVGGRRHYDAADLRLAQGLAGRAALAIENARLYAAAVEAKRLRDEVLGIVSHDLRGPLHSIELGARLLAKRSPAPQLDPIFRAVGRAERLIEDLLTTAMIDAGKLPLERHEEQVEQLVDEVVELHRALAEDKSIALEATVEEGLPAASVDGHRVVQLLSNLVGNAIKFTPGGGRVELTASRVGGELRLIVSDTGPGIPAEQMAHLFDRFWQAVHVRRAGAGLGLAIARGIAEAHGGGIRVESEVGRGARFTVSLPFAAPPAARDQASLPPRAGAQPEMGMAVGLELGERR